MSRPTLAAQNGNRNGQIAKLHIAKKDLGLTDADYRDLLFAVTKKHSAADLNEYELARVLDRMKQMGFKPKAAAAPGGKAHVGMILRLWAKLGEAGALTDPSENALRAFVRRQTVTETMTGGVSAPQFLNADQATKVIEGLKAWLVRAKKKQA